MATAYTQLNGYAFVDDDNASARVIETKDLNLYFYVEKIVVSVYKAAEGSGGILEFADAVGTVFYRTNVDGVRDLPLDFGMEGIKVGKTSGIHVLLSGADKQASVAVLMTGHLAVD